VTILLLSFGWIVNGVYTNRYSNILEWFYTINLFAITCASGYGDIAIRQILVYSCVSLSLLVSLGTVSYHIWLRCSESCIIKKCASKGVELKTNNFFQISMEQKTSDVDIINRDKSRDDITTTDCSIEMDTVVHKRESMIFND
jgi:hypothetical protein